MPPHKVSAHRRQQVHEGKGMLALLGLAAGLLAVFGTGVDALDVDRTDGGYTGLSVSIHRDVPYNEALVENLKALFRSSSEFLHRATNGRVYFKQVTINFPDTWPQRTKARPSPAGRFDKSDVRVDVPGSSVTNGSGNDIYADQPFTKQIMRCGHPGDFIQLTPTFLLELNGSTTQRFGKPAYAFVHEWAHFRYGVFDEHGYLHDDTYPLTYCHEGKVKLNSCSSKIAFTARTPSGGKCEMDARCRVLSKDCVFGFYQNAEKSVESSVMFMPYVDNVSQFCDDTKKGSRPHNPLAPNKQNAICKGLPTWEVISSNDDFKNLPRPDLSKRIQVTFKETQESTKVPQRVVILLDVSTSMNTYSRMQFLREALLRYVIDAAEGSQELAVVTFSTGAKVVHSLSPVNNRTRVGFIKDIQNLRPLDSTCIGCGLKEALKVLGKASAREGGIIILVSDGEENVRPLVAEVLQDVLRSKVIVNTVAIGSEADPNLEMLAAVTKGKAYFFQDGQGNVQLGLKNAFEEAAASAKDAARLPVTLLDTEASFSGNLKQDFFVDDVVGKNTVVYIHTKQPGEAKILYVWLTDPKEQHCTTACRANISGADIVIKLPQSPMPGMWSVHLSTHVDNKVDANIQVKSYVRDESVKPINVNCRVASLIVNKPEDAIVYVEVSKEKKVVLDAAVSARAIGPNDTQSALFPLRDDGKDPDNHADDGTYSGYVTQFNGGGRYAVTAFVSSQTDTRLADRNLGSGEFVNAAALQSSKPGAGKDVPSLEYSFDYFVIANTTSEAGKRDNSKSEYMVHHFQRVVSGGSFQVNATKKKSQVKPKKIEKLLVFFKGPAVSGGRPLIQVSWSWRGQQQADPFERFRVIIRGSLDHSKVTTDFRHQVPISETDIVEGSLKILPTQEKYTITALLPNAIVAQLPESSKTVYFAARVLSTNGLRSDLSNVASVACSLSRALTAPANPTTTPPDTTESTTARAEEIDTTPATSISTSLTIDDTSPPDVKTGTDPSTSVASATNATSDANTDMTRQATVSTDTSTEEKTTEETTPSGITAYDTISPAAGISASTEGSGAKTEITTPVTSVAAYKKTTAQAVTTTEESRTRNTSPSSAEQTTAYVSEASGGDQPISVSTPSGTSFHDLENGTDATTTVVSATSATNDASGTDADTTTQGTISAVTGVKLRTTSSERTATFEPTAYEMVSPTARITAATDPSGAKAEVTTQVGTLAARNETTAEAVTTTAERITSSDSRTSPDRTTSDATEASIGDQAVTSELSTIKGASFDGVTEDEALVLNFRGQQKTSLGGLSTRMYVLIGGVAAVVVIAAIVAMVIRRRRKKDDDYIVMFTKSGQEEASA